MPMHAPSYFAGVGTVVATLVLGFGSGVLMTDAFVGKSENAPTKLERRAAPLADSSTPSVAVAQNPTAPEASPVVAEKPATLATLQSLAAPPTPIAAPQSTSPTSPGSATQEPPRQPDQAMARANDDDVKKALAAKSQKAQRRKWAERRKREKQKIEELNAVAERVNEIEREREPIARSFIAESPVIRLFGD